MVCYPVIKWPAGWSLTGRAEEEKGSGVWRERKGRKYCRGGGDGDVGARESEIERKREKEREREEVGLGRPPGLSGNCGCVGLGTVLHYAYC